MWIKDANSTEFCFEKRFIWYAVPHNRYPSPCEACEQTGVLHCCKLSTSCHRTYHIVDPQWWLQQARDGRTVLTTVNHSWWLILQLHPCHNVGYWNTYRQVHQAVQERRVGNRPKPSRYPALMFCDTEGHTSGHAHPQETDARHFNCDFTVSAPAAWMGARWGRRGCAVLVRGSIIHYLDSR